MTSLQDRVLIPLTLVNAPMSAEAKMVLIERLATGVPWTGSLVDIITVHGWSVERTRKAVRELRNHAYLHHVRVQAAGRRGNEYRYEYYDTPQAPCATAGCIDCENGRYTR